MNQAVMIGIGNSNISQTIKIDPKISSLIGRSNLDNENYSEKLFWWKSSKISREHAKIYLSEGKYLIEDLGSISGTYINDKKIGEEISNLKDIYSSIKKDELRNLNRGLDTLLDGSIIEIGKELIKDEESYKFYFSLNSKLNAFFVEENINSEFLITTPSILNFEGENYIVENSQNKDFLEMKIICKNPLLEYTKKIQYPTPGYTYIGESLEELNINEKNNLINEINLFLKPKIISKKKIELKIK